MKPTKLSPNQLKMKALLKPIVGGILKEAELDFQPNKIPNMDKIFEKYGLLDVLYTAHLYYTGTEEKTGVEMIKNMIKVYRTSMTAANP